MADVAALFKKKKKGKKKKAKSFNAKLKEAGGQLPGAVSTKNKVEQESVKASQSTETDLLAALSKAKNISLSTDIAQEVEPDKAKLEEMNLREYRQHQDKIKTRESFHKTRKKVFKKENSANEPEKPVEPAVPVKKSWRQRAMDRANAESGANISKQLQSEAAFPTLGGGTVKKVTGGAWGTTADDVESDEEIDPEEERRKAEELEKKRLEEEERKAVWKPSTVDEDIATSDKFGRKVNSALDEFLQIEDYAEVVLCFQELRNPNTHEKIATKIIEKGMDNQPEKKQTLLADLLVHMRKKKPYMLTKDQIENAFKTMEDLLDDLVVDFPKAKEVFAHIKKKCQLKGALGGLKQKFISSGTFAGAKEGYDYKMGANGMGYYLQGGKFHGSEDSGRSGAGSSTAASSKPSPFGSARPVTTGKKSSIFGDAKPIDIDAKLAEKASSRETAPTKTKVNPFGAAKPVDTKQSIFGDAKPVDIEAKLAKKAPTAASVPGTNATKKKINPFGAAKPVDIKAPPAREESNVAATSPAIVRKKSNPFGDAKPVDIQVSSETQPPPAPVVRKKVDPFGGATPVDTTKNVNGGEGKNEDEPNPFAKLKKKKKKKKKAYVPDLS